MLLRQYRAIAKDYGLTQELPPDTPRQNELCERFIKTSREEFCWCHRFQSIEHASPKPRAWIHRCNHRRPHQSLKYKSPSQCHQHQGTQAA